MKISPANNILLVTFCLTLYVSICNALLDGIYCGRDNCYDVLEITREATSAEVRRQYRRLAKKTHPDLFRDEVQKKEAEEKFKAIATAYEILRDDEARKDYDYMLDNPEEYYSHYYRYYRRRMAPKVDVRLVVFVTITVISIIQYYSLWQRYDSAIKYFMTVPKYRIKAMEIVAEQQRQEESANSNAKNGKAKSRNRVSKAELKEEQERKIRQVIEEKLDIKGAYAKPTIFDLLWLQLIILPYTITMYLFWYAKWTWRFTILRQPYGEEEKLYLIRKYMKIGQNQFDGLEDHEKQNFLDMELWIKENFTEWKAEQEEEMKAKLAESARHKSYRRYMKNHGPSRMTFED